MSGMVRVHVLSATHVSSYFEELSPQVGAYCHDDDVEVITPVWA